MTSTKEPGPSREALGLAEVTAVAIGKPEFTQTFAKLLYAFALKARLTAIQDLRRKFSETREPTMIGAWLRAYRLIDEQIADLQRQINGEKP